MMQLKRMFVIFLFFLWHSVRAQVSFDSYVISGVTVIDAIHPVSVAHQTILISRGSIIDIFNDGSKPIPDSVSIVRMEGKYVVPGLIDAHVHMATDPSGSDSREYTLGVLRKMLYSGVTSVRDMAGDARTLASLSRDAFTGDIMSPDIYYSALMAGPVFFKDSRTVLTTKGAVAGKTPYMFAVTGYTNLSSAVAEAKGTGATGIKLYANLAAPLIAKIVREAARQNMLVWAHAWLQNDKPSAVIEAGVGVVSHSPLLLHEKLDTIPLSWKNQRHTAKFWDDVTPNLSALFTLMKARHTILDATLWTYKELGKTDSTRRYTYEIGKRITAQAYKAGVLVTAGTDNDQKEFVHKEIELLVKEINFTAIDAITAATLNGAKALHIDNTRGTISIGKIADLVVLNKNPLQNIDNIESVYMVVKAGKFFKK